MQKITRLIFVLLLAFPVAGMSQGLHFGLKGGVLGNKASVSGITSNVQEDNWTGFQVGPMVQYQTGFYGITLDFSLLYAQRGVKLTNRTSRKSADIRTQHIDIPIELKWEMGISRGFDLFLGVGPSFSFLIDKDNWAREFSHIAADVINKDLGSMGWRSTDVGFNVGGGVKLMQHLMLSCYYNIPLTNSAKYHVSGDVHGIIDDIFDGNVVETKNRYWQLSLAYIF